MTEAEWLACDDPSPMLEFARGRVNCRKYRLLAVAYCRRVWHLLSDERSRCAVEVAEAYADGLCGEEAKANAIQAEHEVSKAQQSLVPRKKGDHAHAMRIAEFAAENVLTGLPLHSARKCNSWASLALAMESLGEDGWKLAIDDSVDADGRQKAEEANHAKLLRDVFGNPFSPKTFGDIWRTATVSSQAQAVYADRAFDRMPILADALEDAGCTDAAILDHCRQPGEHVRGCWVVDLVLGKE